MPALITGEGSLQSLPETIRASRVLLLTYGRGLENPEVRRLIERWGSRVELRHVPFSPPLLTVEQVAALSAPILEGPVPDVLVTVGGGAVLDAAKCLKLLLDCRVDPAELLTHHDRTWHGDTPHVAVPTTAGTGSEATCFATVYVGETKHSVEDPHLLPGKVVLDPTLLREVAGDTMTYCAFDALAQAMESAWSVNATEDSLRDALMAVETILDVFEVAVRERSPSALARLQHGAYLAGKAINVSRTTLAHALSYPLSARFGLPHGLAVFLNLPRVIRFNAAMNPETCQDPQGMGHYHEKMGRLFALFGVADHEGLACYLEDLFRRLSVSPRFEDHGVGREDQAWIVRSAVSSSRSGNNPRRADLEALSHDLV